jgi:hypothetical protein
MAMKTIRNLVDDERRVASEKLIGTKARLEIKKLIYDAVEVITYDELFGGDELVNRSGKLAKRLKNNIKKTYDVKLPQDVLEQIGNVAYLDTLESGEYRVKLTGDMATHGDFGDSGSCFLPGHENYHHFCGMDEDSRYFVIKVWRDGKSFARCWAFVPHSESGQVMVLFNSYGLVMDKMRNVVANAFPELRMFTEIGFDTDVYGNGDRCVFTVNGHTPERSSYYGDVSIGRICCSCDEVIEDGEEYEVDGDYLCECCFNERYVLCTSCDRPVEYGDEVNIGWDAYCYDCAHSYHTRCDDCGEWIDNDFIHEDNGDDVCEDCLRERERNRETEQDSD